MMRRLLLIEAAAYPKPNTPPRLWPKRTRVRRLVGFDDDKPETWRVRFRCFRSPLPGRSARRAGAHCSKRPDTLESGATMDPGFSRAAHAWPGSVKGRFYSAWPLAERYEALIRVFNNPAPRAKRLATRLHALTHRVAELLRAPPEAQHRVQRFEALTDAAKVPWRPPNTS
ncbi:MAG: hypothetical protein HY054_11610 [Proteobacteria bacterium]|nr:hypothetical protein [Pseudomonadota bacterium]